MAVRENIRSGDREAGERVPDRVEYSSTVMTPEQLQRRRRRNLAIGLLVGALALLFYVVTIVKMGPAILNRPL